MPAEPLLNPAVDGSGAPPLHILPVDQTKRCAACQRPLASTLASADQLSQQQQQDVGDTSGASFCVACREARLVRYSPIDDSLQQQQQQQQRPSVRSIRRRTGSITSGSNPGLTVDALQVQSLQVQHHLPTQLQVQSPATPTTPRAGELDGEIEGAHRRERERHARPFSVGGALTRPDPHIPHHPHRTLPLPLRAQQQRTQLQQPNSESNSNNNNTILTSGKEQERSLSPVRLSSSSISTPPSPSSPSSSFSFSSASGSTALTTHALHAHSERRSPQRHGSKDSRGNGRNRQPDPLVDITRLRVRSRGYKCLYPGATFKGSQKSGRNSYDVTVTIIVRWSRCRFSYSIGIDCPAPAPSVRLSPTHRISTSLLPMHAGTCVSVASPRTGPSSRLISMRRSLVRSMGSIRSKVRTGARSARTIWCTGAGSLRSMR